MSSVLALDRGVQTGNNSLSFTPISVDKNFPLKNASSYVSSVDKLYLKMLNIAVFNPSKHQQTPSRQKKITQTLSISYSNAHPNAHPPFAWKSFLNLCSFIYMAVYNWSAVFLLIWHTFSERRIFRFNRIRMFKIKLTKASAQSHIFNQRIVADLKETVTKVWGDLGA